MANDYTIPYAVPDYSESLTSLANVFQKKKERRQRDEELNIQREKVRNDERRLNNEEYRRKMDWEQGQQDRRDKARASAKVLFDKGDKSGALALLQEHGIGGVEETSAPTLYTPAMALAAANKQSDTGLPTGAPGMPEQSPAITPMNALAPRNDMPEGIDAITGPTPGPERYAPKPPPGGDLSLDNLMTAASQPESHQRRFDPQSAGYSEEAPLAATPPPGAGHAVEDLLPMTEDGKPTGAYKFTGPSGQDMGRYDPEEQRQFRRTQADEAQTLYGDLDPRFGNLAATLIAQGVPPEKVGPLIATAMEHRSLAEQKSADIDARQKAQQDFTAQQHALYSETHAGRVELANIRAKMLAMVTGTATPADMTHLAELLNNFKQHGDVGQAAAEAAAFKPPLQPKIWEPPTKQMTTQAKAGEGAEQKREGLDATDEHGVKFGVWKNPKAAAEGNAYVSDFARVRERFKAVLDDVRTNGERIAPDTKDYVRRRSNFESLAVALRPFNKLSNTDKSLQAERVIVGPTGAFGHGWVLGADLQTLEKLFAEAEGQQKANINARLKPGGGSPMAPALSGHAADQGGGAEPNVHWGPIPPRLASKYPGKTEIAIDAQNNIVGSR